MCAHYIIFSQPENAELGAILSMLNNANYKTGDILPTDIAPVLLSSENGELTAKPLKWGFPRYDGKGIVFNARSETAFEKQMFRSSISQRRCIIPSTGFYEWRHIDKRNKEKYLFQLGGSPVLYMAGFYNYFTLSDGAAIPMFIILTSAANSSVSPIHDRMPMVLRPEDKSMWLGTADEARTLLAKEPPLLSPRLVS